MNTNIGLKLRLIIGTAGVCICSLLMAQDSIMNQAQMEQIRASFSERFTGADFGTVEWDREKGHYKGTFEYNDERNYCQV